MDRTSEGESSPGCRVNSSPGGAGGCVVSGSDMQLTQHHSKDHPDLGQITEALER